MSIATYPAAPRPRPTRGNPLRGLAEALQLLHAARVAPQPVRTTIPTRRLAIHPLIAGQLTVDHDGYEADTPAGRVDLSAFWPVSATVNVPVTDPPWEGRMHLTRFNGQRVIGARDLGWQAATQALAVLLTDGRQLLLDRDDLADLEILD